MLSYVLRTLKLGIKSLSLHALRSSLAMVGILIGVMAVIWLVALGEGVSDQAQKQIEQLGARNIIIKSVKPAASGTSGDRTFVTIYGLTDADYDRLITIPTVKRAVPMRELSTVVRHEGHAMAAQLVGCVSDYYQINHLSMAQGRFLEQQHEIDKATVCVVAADVALELFPLQNPIGKRILIDQDFYTVIGVTESRESSASIGGSLAGREYNRDIYIPVTTFRTRLGDELTTSPSGGVDRELVEISQITLMIEDVELVEESAAIARILLEKYHLEDDYSIVVPKELLRQAEVLRAMFNVLLVLIAGISLLVGGIGIMNIMLATVTERTREIGVRRALGARRSDIITQFLAETVVLTGTGGLTGVAFGFLCGPAVFGVQYVLKNFLPNVWTTLPPAIQNLEPLVAPWSVGAAFSISVIVGVLFGLYPARRAALMDPIEALRHE
ncbi:MAG: ABC transporter permease [Planctomycetota bacterium]|nr:ABC transporter permease [Planctomycetota bacterium]MDA0919697.1 ABC transporter permease [Planctomycetota bacterium]